MNVYIYDQYSELQEAVSFHTGEITSQYKSLSALEYVAKSNLTKEEAVKEVDNIVEDTKKLGIGYNIKIRELGYAEIEVDLEELKGTTNLYRVIFIK